MANTHDYSIANDTGSAVRSDLNTLFAQQQATNAGTSAPTSAVEGMLWEDTTNNILKQYDGSSWVEVIKRVGTGTAQALGTGDSPTFAGLTLPNDALSGDDIDGGTISNFASTGIDDNATSTAITIDNSGNVLVGSFSASGASAGFAFNPLGDLGFGTRTSTVISGFSYQHRFYNPNGQVGYISTSGSATSYVTSSDYRLKENVVPMTGSIDRLKQLKPSRFNFIADADTTVDGFLAHEAQVVVPEAITGEKDAMRTEEYEVTPAVTDEEGNITTEAVMGEREVPDYQGIDQSKLVPLLVASLQEAVAKIEALETRVKQQSV